MRNSNIRRIKGGETKYLDRTGILTTEYCIVESHNTQRTPDTPHTPIGGIFSNKFGFFLHIP